jgi:Tfp pilus assembly protein PilO
VTPKRFFFVLCGILCLLIVAGGIAYYYASASLASRTRTLSQRLADENLADQHISDLSDLKDQYNRLLPLVPVIYAALPNQKDQSAIALQLHDIAAASGMNLNSLTFNASTIPGPTSQTIPSGSVLAIPITFQLQGSYNQLQEFLQKQESLNRYTSVTSLGISGSGNSLSFAITLNAFVKP